MNLAPSRTHLMGTDEFGRDVFSRIIHGSRISVYVGVVSVGLSVLIGVLIGAVAGYYGGWLDQLLSAVTDLTWSLPEILVALLLVAIVGAGLECVIIAVALTYWAQYARLIRGQILMLKTEVYVEATRSFGGYRFYDSFPPPVSQRHRPRCWWPPPSGSGRPSCSRRPSVFWAWGPNRPCPAGAP